VLALGERACANEVVGCYKDHPLTPRALCSSSQATPLRQEFIGVCAAVDTWPLFALSRPPSVNKCYEREKNARIWECAEGRQRKHQFDFMP